jgi:hypothetical protein
MCPIGGVTLFGETLFCGQRRGGGNILTRCGLIGQDNQSIYMCDAAWAAELFHFGTFTAE